MKEKKFLFISHVNFLEDDYTGGKKLARSHYKMLKTIFGDKNVVAVVLGDGQDSDLLYYMGKTKSRIHSLFYSIFGYIRGYSPSAEKKLINIFSKNSFDYVFCDFSCYGKTIKKIKKINNNIKIFTFFHNVESCYEFNRMKKESFLFFFSYLSAKKQEKLTLRLADKTIALNERDINKIKQIYKHDIDLLMPIIVEDKTTSTKKVDGEFLLFVGSLFGPNLDGVKWYVKNVAPHVKYKTLVVGKGFEDLRDELSSDNVEIIGTVDDVAEYYNGAIALVMPILYGDGMKVKTAEALMYGKTVIGTTEAFEGYAIQDGREGYCVNTADEFINVINNSKLISDNKYSRGLYEQKYSLPACTEDLRKLFLSFESEDFN